MCGIFACSLTGGKNITNSKQQAFEALKLLEYRGYDSFGIYSTISAPNLGGVRGGENLEKHVGAVSNVKIKFSSKDKFNISLGHTRWATHGKVSNENTHPHLSNNKNFVIVHNGIFENYEEVKKELLKNKYKFYGETDTKILVNYFEYSKNKNEIEKFKKNVKGSSAFVIYSKNENKFYIYKNGSALYIAQDENKNLYISSDVSTLVEYTKKI
jgi:glucosamine--fructose-6-phosphate aminotransferase (isomerizing)